MKTCGKGCIPLCNHCKHHSHSKDDADSIVCDLDESTHHPTESCEEFHCWMLCKKRKVKMRPPRYDEVYFKGLEMLNKL